MPAARSAGRRGGIHGSKRIKRPKRASARLAGRDPETQKSVPHEANPETAKAVLELAQRGASDVEIAVLLDLRPGHVRAYQKIIAQEQARHNLEVTEALRVAALGAEEPDTHVAVNLDQKTGKVNVTKVPMIKHYPPNVAAIQFFLKNRKPTEFKDQPTGGLDPDSTAQLVKDRLELILKSTGGR